MILERYNQSTLYIIIPMLYLSIPDIVTGALSAYIALNAPKYTKVLLSLLSISYYLRVFSVILGIEPSSLLLVVAEIIRSILAIALALYSSLKGSTIWLEKEVNSILF